MKAMRLEAIRTPLVMRDLPDPDPGPNEVRIRVEACGVCRTDLHVVDGDLAARRTPLTQGHEIVGFVDRLGEQVSALALGQRVGVGWLGSTCHRCSYCRARQENLCDSPGFTGCTRDGGFATHVIADARYAYHLPEHADAADLAPLMCAGLIGWRSLRFAGKAESIGFYGFGAAAHIILQVARWQRRKTFAFTRPGEKRRKRLPAISAPTGSAVPTNARRNLWMPPSSMRPWASWCPSLCEPSEKAAASFAPESI